MQQLTLAALGLAEVGAGTLSSVYSSKPDFDIPL